MKKLSLLFAALLAVSMSFATTVTKTVNQLVEENEWTVSSGNDIGTLATNFALDNVITVSTTGASNCGAIYAIATGSTTYEWRLYQAKNGNVKIAAAEGYTLSTVKLTFTVAKTGVLLDAEGNTVASNSEIEVNAQNVTFTVGNSGTATNGQVKITAFEVTYLAVGDSTIIPVDTTIVPVDTTIVPVDTTIVPVDTTIVPVDTTIVPVDTTVVPVDTTIVPVDTIALNCADARTLALTLEHNTPTQQIYAVTGYITEVVGNVSRNQQTFWMADTLEGGRVFEGYWANLPEGVEAFVEGMQIRMIGNLVKHNTTPEIKNGNVEILAMPVITEDTTIVPVDTIALNCADARTLALDLTTNDTPTEQIYAVTGYITEVVGNVSRNQQTFWMADTLEGGRVFEGYWANLPEGVEAFVEGMQIRMIGNLMKHNTTPEIKNGNVEILAMPIVPIDTDTIIVPPVIEASELVLDAGVWNYQGAKIAAWVWGDDLEAQFTDFFVPMGDSSNLFKGAIPDVADTLVLVRLADTATVPAWSAKWNQTDNLAINFEDMYATITGWGEEGANSPCVWGTPVPEPVKYFIKNNWNGGDWAWVEMNTVIDSVLYDYIGVFGGSGVDINTTAADEGSTWFSVADFRTIDSTYVPQALDTIHFVYSIVDSVIAVELVGRPAPAPLTYYIKNNWNGGDWAWVEMNTVIDSVLYDYTGVWGGTGVDIRHNRMPDTVSIWIPAEDFRTLDSTYVPQALDTIHFVYSIVDSVLAVELVNRPEPIYYIKNNWNGGEEWYWVEMNPVVDNSVYEYTGVWGGTGVDIRHNRMPDTASIWFPVEKFSVLDSTYVPQALDTIHFVYSIVDSALAVEFVGRPALVYYIKNNWDGAAATDWTWREMTPVVNNSVYEYTGVWGGTGVDIRHNRMPDTASIWFPVEKFSLLDSTYVPQALDTIHFVYSIVDSALAVEFVGRPALVYYIKNNWDGAAATDWTWREMTPVVNNSVYEYTGVWGGTGVDIRHNRMPDTASIWFPVEKFSVLDSTYVPQALDTIHFVYSIVDSALAVEFVGRPAPAPEVFQIKNNWNGGEWTWVEMTPVDSVENVYQYTGIFGGKGVNITSNYMNGELWFPVDSFLLNEGDLVPQYKDTVLFAYNSVENEVAAMVLGRHIFNTCAEVNAITANTNMELGEVTVVFAKGSYIYVEDATATTLVYTNKYGNLKAGDRVWGIAGEAKLYSDLPELAANTDFDKLVVTEGAARAIEDATAAPTTADINKVLMFRNVTMLDSAFTTPNGKAMNINGIFNGDTVAFRNNWKETYTFEEGKTYSMLGCVAIYNGNIQVYVTNFEEYAPVQYYIKNNWNRATDWTWEEMIPANDGGETWMYTGIFGGTGVDINTAMNDEGKKWFAIADMIIPEGNVAPEAGDSVMFVYNTIDETMTATVLSQVIPGEDITVTVWVRNENTNWEHLYVYGWGGAEEIFGAWPGLQLDVDYVLEPDKFDYTNMFHITGDYEGLEENLIFNSGAGQQFPDLKILLTEDAEYYIVITNDGAHFEGEEGLETVIANSENETVKVIMNGQLYIVRDGKVYNALGAQVR